MAASKAVTPRTSVILSTVITEKSFFFEDGLMFKAHRLVIPTSLGAEYLKDRQAAYLAGDKTLLKAQETVFWSGISEYVINAVKLCDVCQQKIVTGLHGLP